jgi:hypothetical protein
MQQQDLSFAPDRRSIQGMTFHFSERPSGTFGARGYSQQDQLTYALDRVYRDRFPDLDRGTRELLLQLLVNNVPLSHRNLLFLATAMLIVYDMRIKGNNEFTPEAFNSYFNYSLQFIATDVTDKNPEEIHKLIANFKVTLLRYLFYIQEHVPLTVLPVSTRNKENMKK